MTTTDDLLLLSRSDVARLMDYAGYVDAVEAAFRRIVLVLLLLSGIALLIPR
ncbi:MAG TPA: hypothetical protein VF915_23635 [Reyranella sp.]